ncbi:hypothetical protein PMW_44 [Pseudomonas phage phiPMW]|uniref:Uncharacterized protein n=1 Tax=Pseudomonas phage phiPMW TaxID=1815582 RepID=A0A1S5R1A1_9CAUD|nr:hypothetical protein FDG97_gp044 [Pseudomonas phage phiPMW]ANA49169.1 hypothetical protein PMW_44 [Pseudomonas phage phiPMW]
MRTVKATRRPLQQSLRRKEDWRTILRSPEPLSSADTLDARAQAIDDCKYALKLNAGLSSYAALWNHFAMWLYNNDEIVVDTHPDHAYYLAIKEIREKWQTSQCLLR